MASTFQKVDAAILASNTVLYTAFVSGGAARATIISLDFTNTTTSDITLDVGKGAAGAITRRFGDDFVVPAKGSRTWRGAIVFDSAGDELIAIATATGVDVLGGVLEDA